MKQISRKGRAITGILACLLIGLMSVSLQDTPIVNQVLNEQSDSPDSVPKKQMPSMTMEAFDNMLLSLDHSMPRLDPSICNLEVQQIQAETLAQLQKVDIEQIARDLQRTMREVDMEKLLAESRASLEKIDWPKLEEDVKHSLKDAEVEMEKAKKELKSINEDQLKKELDQARNEINSIDKEAIEQELAKAKVELEKCNVAFDKNKVEMSGGLRQLMDAANVNIDKARDEMHMLKEMFNALERDGLIDSRKGFIIEFRSPDLFINGKKQPSEISEKYRGFFKGDNFEMRILGERI